MSLGPLDLPGGPFLVLYGLLLALAVTAGLAIPALMRPAGAAQRVTNVDQLALLAGGKARFNEAIVSRLLTAKALAIGGRGMIHVIAREPAASPAERALLAMHLPMRWREVEAVLEPHRDALERHLASAGLLMSRAERAKIRFFATLPYFLLLAFGAAKWTIGVARERPVGYLTALLILTAVAAIIRWIRLDRRTRAGREAVATAREQAQRLKVAPTTPEIAQAVALFGTPVLLGSAWSDFHRMRHAAGGGDAGTTGGSCGGGGGGGGCGGCSAG